MTTAPTARSEGSRATGPTARARSLALGADLVCVAVFAVAGKASHEPGDAVSVVLAIVWPFAVAVLVAHAGLALSRRASTTLAAGAVVVATTYVLGMALRAVSGRGLAPGFLVVALVFLAVTLLGWRAVGLLASRRARRTPPA